MASISKEKNRNGWRLSFYGLDKRKRSIWLGGFSKRQADAVKTNVEHLLAAKAAGVAPDVHIARWLGSIGPDLRKKLVTAGLVEPAAEDQGPSTLGPFLNAYIASRRDVKASTREQYYCVSKSLTRFFGESKRLDAITATEAERWRIHVRTEGNRRNEGKGWADNTVRRTTGRARQFFEHAVKLGIVGKNPFAGFPVTVHGNTKRQQFVPQEVIFKAIENTPCPQLRAVIALSRCAGLRVPSEVVALKWNDIDLEANRLTIRASKTEHHEDGGIRFVPVFPELRSFLQALQDLAQPGIACPLTTPVFTRWKSTSQNIGTAFKRVLEQAGIQRWPKLFHNLRASRQTELLAEFPAKDVCDWLGNTQAVAMRHYAMATSDSFERAVGGSTGGSISADQQESEELESPQKPKENGVLSAPEPLLIGTEITRPGLEPGMAGPKPAVLPITPPGNVAWHHGHVRREFMERPLCRQRSIRGGSRRRLVELLPGFGLNYDGH